MPNVSLNLVVIRSPDLERSAKFYNALGMPFTKHRHGNGPEHLTCELGPVVFEIYPRTGEADSTTSTRIGFKVPSVDATVKQLQEIGVKVVSPPKDSPWGRRAVVDDFDGHRLELTQATGD
ncbi:MAG TPA: VOC family protein [Tepidisphaeraceae bacterium]|jgi:predicted enzyme related to lactoylglutathione lyase|nr:VOC family protein [Tepidisphaeraceae bacterium]